MGKNNIFLSEVTWLEKQVLYKLDLGEKIVFKARNLLCATAKMFSLSAFAPTQDSRELASMPLIATMSCV